jgi:hypothetical protein
LKKIYFILFLIVFSFSAAFAQTPVQATGTGAIVNNNEPAARDRAIDDALRKAVEQSLGTYIDSQTKVENFMLVEDRILSWSKGYVSRYNIVSEGKQTPEMYQATVDAVVDVSNLQNDAQAVQDLINNMGNPRVMFLIDEQNVGVTSDRYHYFDVNMTAAETAMMNRFMAKGFDVVDPGISRQNKERDRILAAISGDSKSAALVAASQAAEVVITGKAVAKVAQGIKLGGMKSCQANLTARVVDSDIGSIIATGNKHAAQVHIDEVTGGTKAIEKAANALADELAGKILEKWRSKFYNSTVVKMVVTGIGTYRESVNFKNSLQYYARGVKLVYERNIVGGAAEFDVEITGNARQLARELDNVEIGGYNCSIFSVSQNKVTIKASPIGFQLSDEQEKL